MFGRGWFGRGRGFWRHYIPSTVGGRYRYIGPCRCGMGPHAYYEDESGRIVHAWDLYRVPIATSTTDRTYLVDRLKELEEEKAIIEDEIAEIKKRLNEIEKQNK
ncbi:DUF5320 domain-containing protein [Methanotorris igneus]|uniref:DUF5320 domain-containing protein n=1 Tax=Methanotorris igneus (strain DSM 5666 / JCM 11834 / Kol 5) TaxID=880724 RepID=F6BEZ0_METIK|nr:DUF5320 domain-containing protein [Methanotorris igneus]AEF95726.1 hypothetical protein Metig_0169 [Methanotorris igneus Kol 5]